MKNKFFTGQICAYACIQQKTDAFCCQEFAGYTRMEDLNVKTFDVVALGELLIDFTENGTSAQGNPIYEANPGGAPCNVLSMLNKAGKKTAFIGKVGQDIFRKTFEDSA